MDKRFLWNEMLLQPILAAGDESVHAFVLPVIHGAVFLHKCIMRVRIFYWSLSRYSDFDEDLAKRGCS